MFKFNFIHSNQKEHESSRNVIKTGQKWTEVEEMAYDRLTAAACLGVDTVIPLTPFMKVLLQGNSWVADCNDLQTFDGLAVFVEWIYSAERFLLLARHPMVKTELLDWANAASDDSMPGISRLMYLLWRRRPDLQRTFDLTTSKSQKGYCEWFSEHAFQEYGLTREVIPHARESVLMVLKKSIRSVFVEDNFHRPTTTLSTSDKNNEAKICVVGSFTGEFGIGEHARTIARALDTTGADFEMLNVKLGPHSHSNLSYEGRFSNSGSSDINLFCLNADHSLTTIPQFGSNAFLSGHNILYGYWELSSLPSVWKPYLNLYDEFWAPTQFIADALASSISRPVYHMPISITVEEAEPMSRSELALPEDKFLFLFHFDGFSTAKRKNPHAAIQSFLKAFPCGNEPVGLIIKTKHLSEEALADINAVINGDKRCTLLSGEFSRQKVVALQNCCDAYVSLHRAEGFGLGPAEMMYLGKPVIVTNYSGNTDFTRSTNSCLVDYQIVAVKPGDYSYYEPGQFWAEPDVEHAANYMRKLVADREYAANIGKAASSFMKEHYSPQRIGNRYLERFTAIRRH